MKGGMQWGRSIQSDKCDEKTRERKAKKAVENQIESIYYVITFILGAILLY